MFENMTVGKTIFLGTATYYLIGRKGLPPLFAGIGKYVGQGVGTTLRLKGEFYSASNDSELTRLHSEFQAGLTELQSIRSELQTTATMRRPMTSLRELSQKGSSVTSRPPRPAMDLSTHDLSNQDTVAGRLASAHVAMQTSNEYRYESRTGK